MRVGYGIDIHALGVGDHLTLGGVEIPFQFGVVAHSDGDVLIHAICDALLGAAALGDIGTHFPDSDARFHNIDSRELLRQVHQMLADHHYGVINADATLVIETPKMAPYIVQMRQNIASDLAIPVDCVNIKATTAETLGYVGRGEGIAAHCMVLIELR